MSANAAFSSFIDAIQGFLTALGRAHSDWASYGTASDVQKARNEMHRHHMLMRQWLKVGASRHVFPPSGQTSKQFIATLLANVDMAWHLCRFLHCWNPDDQPDGPDNARLLRDMRERLPVLYDAIRESWRFLQHAQFAESITTEPTADHGQAPLGHSANLPTTRPEESQPVAGVEKTKPPTPKRTRGRKRGNVKYDPTTDATLYTQWKASGCFRYRDFATKNGLDVDEVEAAVNRHQQRNPKSAE